jgi:hypothetical protein
LEEEHLGGSGTQRQEMDAWPAASVVYGRSSPIHTAMHMSPAGPAHNIAGLNFLAVHGERDVHRSIRLWHTVPRILCRLRLEQRLGHKGGKQMSLLQLVGIVEHAMDVGLSDHPW